MNIKYFRFIPINDTLDNTHKKVEEEWGEWNASLGTPEEKEEHIDLIHVLCNLYILKYGYQSMKEEDLANIMDVKNRYNHLLDKPKMLNIVSTSLTPNIDKEDTCFHEYEKNLLRTGLVCRKCEKFIELEDII
jgi:hypothetical protein